MSECITINNGAYVCYYSDSVLTIDSIILTATEKVHYSAPVPNFSEIPNLSPHATISLNMTFYRNRNITKIDFTNWTHKKVIGLYRAFADCYNLRRIIGFETLDLSSCLDYIRMCEKCESLREINMSNSRIKKCNRKLYTYNAFERCPSLTTVIISEKTPEFIFPAKTTIIDVSSSIYKVQTDQINTLRAKLEAEKCRTSKLEERLTAITAQLEELRQKI